MKYVLVIEKGDDGYWGYFPDVPGCTTAGNDLNAVVANAAEALEGHLEGEAVPSARSLSAVVNDPEVIEQLDGSETFTSIDYAEQLAPA